MGTWLHTLVAAVLMLTGKSSPKGALDDATAWASLAAPSHGAAKSIGGYSNGCVAGATALELRTTTYAVAKPSRRRYYGHPELIGFIRDYAKALHVHRLGPLIVGDLGQVRGGPAPSGHKSHQSGLDVDLWYLAPADLGELTALKSDALERQVPVILVKGDGSAAESFEPLVDSRLHRAALDPRVDRIFVHPRIKERLCQRATNDRTWLRKIRPWWGHDAHFHVRLACPQQNIECVSQEPLPAGDGCSELAWWFDPQAQAERSEGQQTYRQNIGKAPQMPGGCRDVFHARGATHDSIRSKR